MSDEPISIQEEENEPHHFGSHNIYMPQAPVGHLLQYYPWRALYETLPFRQPYPQVLYTDHRADEFLNAMSMSLADRKSTRLNSSHANISYAVFCLKKNTTYTS